MRGADYKLRLENDQYAHPQMNNSNMTPSSPHQHHTDLGHTLTAPHRAAEAVGTPLPRATVYNLYLQRAIEERK